jgi:MFS family permease
MTEFYGLPNAEHFWHWPTLVHFAIVALAGGAAVVTAIATITRHPRVRTYALITMVLIVLDLVTLWIESPARFRFTHVWLFLSFTPTAPIWLGAWGLIIALGSSFFVWLDKGPRLLWSAGLVVGSALALVYPGLALALNVNRPLWTPVLLLLFPLTAMVSVLAIAALLRQDWARAPLGWLSLASAVVGVAYLAGLATGGAEARAAFSYLWDHGGTLFVLALALLAAAPLLVRRVPLAAALLPLVSAMVVRSLIVDLGQVQTFGF